MGAKLLQVNMTHGEITPLMHARVESDLYQTGLALARNWIVLRYGGVTRAPGLLYKGALRYANKATYLIPFKFKRSQVYAIEAGDQYFRFWTRDGRIESPPGTPVTIATPYLEADLPKLQVRQLGDVVYIVCEGYPVKTLTRASETSWALADYNARYGPYMPVNTTATSLKPSDRGSLTPIMTNNSSPSGTAADSDSTADAYKAFDGDPGDNVTINGSAGWVEYTPPTSQVVDAYYVQATAGSSDSSMPMRSPTDWFVEGYDGSSYVVLDTRTGEAGWSASEKRFYSFRNTTAYQKYRFRWIAASDTPVGVTTSHAGEIGFNVSGDTQTAFNLTASSVVGINDGAGFQAGDVGRWIRLLASDGFYRDAIIDTYTSATVVKIRIYGAPLPDTSRITNWALGAWGSVPGYPRAIGIKDDRIVFGGTDADPLGVWATRQADYDNMQISQPLVLDDAVSERLTGGELNEIQWFADAQDIIAGTAGSIRAIGTADNTKAFGPGNVRQLAQTPVTTNVTPGFQIENMLVFLDLYGRRLFEAAYSNVPDAYIAKEVSTLQEHLFQTGVRRLAYQGVPNRVLWAVTSEGGLLAITYDRDQKVFGVTQRPVDGVVTDVLSLPAGDADDLFVTIVRTINSVAVGCMELLAPFYRSAVHDYPVYLDSAMVYQGAAANTISGLGRFYHSGGTTEVGVWADGKDYGDYIVPSSGELTLPNGVEAEAVVVGLRLSSRLESLRPGSIGSPDGPSLGRKMKINSARVDLYEAMGLRIGTLAATYDLAYEGQSEIDPFAAPPLLTGSYPMPAEDSFRNSGVFVAETDSAYPATIRGFMVDVDGEP